MNQEELKKRLIEWLIAGDISAQEHIITNYTKAISHIADFLVRKGVTIRERGEWIPVTERLPEEDGKYLVARLEGSRYSISVRKFRKEVPCWYRGYCGHWERRTNGITHWAPLPEPPERSDAE